MLRPLRCHNERSVTPNPQPPTMQRPLTYLSNEQHHVLLVTTPLRPSTPPTNISQPRRRRHSPNIRTLPRNLTLPTHPADFYVPCRLRLRAHGMGPIIRVVRAQRHDGVFVRHPNDILDCVGRGAQLCSARRVSPVRGDWRQLCD
jgi:hypothetical protein